VSQHAVRQLVQRLPERSGCPCATALDAAIVGGREAVPAEVRERLAPILARWLGGSR
jgi:hypothetical protein